MLRHRLHKRRATDKYKVRRMGKTGMISVIGVASGHQLEGAGAASWVGRHGVKSTRRPPRANRTRLGSGLGGPRFRACLSTRIEPDWVGRNHRQDPKFSTRPKRCWSLPSHPCLILLPSEHRALCQQARCGRLMHELVYKALCQTLSTPRALRRLQWWDPVLQSASRNQTDYRVGRTTQHAGTARRTGHGCDIESSSFHPPITALVGRAAKISALFLWCSTRLTRSHRSSSHPHSPEARSNHAGEGRARLGILAPASPCLTTCRTHDHLACG